MPADCSRSPCPITDIKKGGRELSNEQKKQFSLTLLVRVLLTVLIVVSIGLFANSLMRYNALEEETAELEAELKDYRDEREELQDLLAAAQDGEIDYETLVRIAREKLGLYFPDEEIFYDKQN